MRLIMRLELFVLLSLTVSNVLALKGLKTRSLRRLQDGGLPVAGATPKTGAPGTVKDPQMPPGMVKDANMPPGMVKDPNMPPTKKEGGVGPDAKGMPKDPKGKKKCKKAKFPPATRPDKVPEARVLLAGEEPPLPAPAMEEYCLHGEVTSEECQVAKIGNFPQGHQSIHGDVTIDITHTTGSESQEVLSNFEQRLSSETAAEFIGCDRRRQYRRAAETGTNSTDTNNGMPPVMEDNIQVTGVDFTNSKVLNIGTKKCPWYLVLLLYYLVLFLTELLVFCCYSSLKSRLRKQERDCIMQYNI
jgi:hypothetical protein